MYARSLDAGAFFSHLRGRGSMEMKGQEENEQQDRDTDQAAKLVRVLRIGNQHRLNVTNAMSHVNEADAAKITTGALNKKASSDP